MNLFKDKRVGVRAAIITSVIGSVAAVLVAIIAKFPNSFWSSAKIRLVQFTINSDSCFYSIDSNNRVGRFYGNLSQEQISKSGKIFNPLIDMTFSNVGEEDAILTKVKIKVINYTDATTAGPGNDSYVIPATHKYQFTVPDIRDDKLPSITKEMLPPLLILKKGAGRIFLELSKAANYPVYTVLEIKFIFDNGQEIEKIITVDF